MEKQKKGNIVAIGIGAVIYVAIILLACIFLIVPGADQFKGGRSIQSLTYEEKTTLIDEVNQKYVVKEQEVRDKYAPITAEINQKYRDLESQIKDQYTVKEQEIASQISIKEADRNKEFFASGFSNLYYTLGDEIQVLRDEKNDLQEQKQKEIYHNERKMRSELKTVEENQVSELKRLNENKQDEITKINNQNDHKKETQIKGMIQVGVGCILILIPLLYVVFIFNKLTHLRNSVKEKWSQVDVYLKQRTDLIPNILESVKGFSTHEKSTLTSVTKARNQVLQATTREEEIDANKNLSNFVQRLFLLQEDYPELKSNHHFLDLQSNLREIEEKISYARQHYNKAVLNYKNKMEMFPSNVIASIFRFQPELFFHVEEEDRENPNIHFE